MHARAAVVLLQVALWGVLPGVVVSEPSRVIGVLDPEGPCPTDEQVGNLTHIFVAHDTVTGGVCDAQCNAAISLDAVCEKKEQKGLVGKWQAQGRKVVLSFGGPEMGTAQQNTPGCWEACFGKADALVQQLQEAVQLTGYNGLNIGYEYRLENDTAANFMKGPEAREFLERVTTQLSSKLPAVELSQSLPAAAVAEIDSPHSNILKLQGPSGSHLDYAILQYYNTSISPFQNLTATAAHFGMVVDQLLLGNSSRAVLGLCIDPAKCGPDDVAAIDPALTLIRKLNEAFPCNGGVAYDGIENDASGAWAREAAAEVANGCVKAMNECDADPCKGQICMDPVAFDNSTWDFVCQCPDDAAVTNTGGPAECDDDDDGIPYWIIYVAAGVGFVLLVLIIFCLHRSCSDHARLKDYLDDGAPYVAKL